jgi:hypothetical protein
MTIAAAPSRADMIRAYAAGHRGLSPFEIAHELKDRMPGLSPREVSDALSRGDAPRIRLVAE